MSKRDDVLTTGFGKPVDDDQNSMTAGPKGPVLMQDVHLLEKLGHFDRERTPERVVHAKGAGAHGYFEVTADVTKYTKADFLSTVGKKTEVFARFSTVGGEKGSADAERDPRGFAIKFYTQEGNYDMTGNNTPVFFIRDPLKFPDFIHTQKRNPRTNLKDPDMFWDFLSLTPESVHQVMVLFSDRGTPADFRHMNGYSSHTYVWSNAAGEQFYVQYHFKTEQGIKNFTAAEADAMKAADADHATRDLFEAIERGEYPEWRLEMQIMPVAEADNYRFDVFDITKVWPHADYPPMTIGRMVLDRNPDNYFAEVEQSAFNPSNFVPGIGPSADKMLQARLFSYHDTLLHRLGSNYHLLPVNAPKNAPMSSYQRDGHMRFDDNGGAGPNYWPNSLDGAGPDPSAGDPGMPVTGETGRTPYPHPNDDFVQPGALYRDVMSDKDRDHLVGNITGHLKNAQERIRLRQCAVFYKVDPDLGMRIAQGVGVDVATVERLVAMSSDERAAATVK
ncbi:MAG: catalase [Actinomycetota bacterium]|jgi:catalase|nr:catalase [Actinomycetota bacterium]